MQNFYEQQKWTNQGQIEWLEEQPYKALKHKVDCAPRFTWVLDTACLPNPIWSILILIEVVVKKKYVTTVCSWASVKAFCSLKIQYSRESLYIFFVSEEVYIVSMPVFLYLPTFLVMKVCIVRFSRKLA